MKINADLKQRAVIETEALDWVASPAPGVERRMLDRDGAESGRATSVVRFAAGSEFPPHDHPGGEEFLVLEGTFSDETGDLGPGTYVRNPVGSRHKPASRDGCTSAPAAAYASARSRASTNPRSTTWSRIARGGARSPVPIRASGRGLGAVRR